MQNPAPPPKFRRTCPACNRTVEPGYKFCKTCGKRIPELSTCSKCGTQFIAPIKICDLCGAPVIPGEVPEPADSPEPGEVEDTGPVEDQNPVLCEEEIPEPEMDEFPEDNDEETIVPADDETPGQYKVVQEPDTDELLEQFGEEYGEDETLESHKKRKSPETVDDVLLLSPQKMESPAKPRVKMTRIIGGCIVLTVIIAAVYFIGPAILPDHGSFSAPLNPPAAEITPLPVPTLPGTVPTALAPASSALVPLPTQAMPPSQKIYFQVQKNPATARISVIFTGSAGEGSINNANIKVTHPDGSVATGIIMPLKGVNEIILEGSKETDRVEIIAQMSDGGTYRVYDTLVPLMRL